MSNLNNPYILVERLILVGVMIVLVLCVIALFHVGTSPHPTEYEKRVELFEQCIADDTFTREECVIIAGGGK